MKRVHRIGIFSFSILLVLLSISLVSARSIVTDLKAVGQGAFDLVKPIVEAVLGNVPQQEYAFARVLILLIVFAVIWGVLSRIEFFSDNGAVLWIISIAASILAVRFIISTSLIEAIILPYKTLGVAISAAIPFVIAALIIHSDAGLGSTTIPSTVRRIAWIFFGVIMLGLWIARYDAIAAAGSDPAALYIYPITALLAVIMMFMDGTIQKWKAKMDISKLNSSTISAEIRELKRDLTKAHNDYRKRIIDKATYNKEVKEIIDRIKTLESNIK